MKVDVGMPLFINEIGERSRQEDTIMPSAGVASENNRLFILCDGMGGHQHGDMASRIVADSLYTCLKQSNESITSDSVGDAIDKAYDALDSFGMQDGFRQMGTTMVSLYVADDRYIAAHIGDSRIYHIRPNLYDENNPKDCIMYQSFDHSLVNMLIKMGEITEEEGERHPERHILLKAMQPGLGENRFRPYIHVSEDLLPGDYFFLCSDGVSDYIDNATIAKIISSTARKNVEKIEEIDALCRQQSKDNYSCWLVPILERTERTE